MITKNTFNNSTVIEPYQNKNKVSRKGKRTR